MSHVLVTGGAGFIGSHIVKRFKDGGYEVSVVDDLSSGTKEALPPDVPLYVMDILSPELGNLLARIRPDVVIHLAAQTDVPFSVENPLVDARINIEGTVNVLDAARKGGVRHFLFASSAAVYGEVDTLPITESTPLRPRSPYGMSKMSGEGYVRLMAESHDMVYTIFRLANVYGPGQEKAKESGVTSLFFDRLMKGEPPLVYGDGCQTRDFVYVRDVAEGFFLAVKFSAQGTFHLSTGKETSINELLELLGRLFPAAPPARYVEARAGDIKHSVLSNAKIRERLGWQPKYTLWEGLQEMLEIRYNQTR